MLVETSKNSETQNYHLLGAIVVPRPIAWIATHDKVLNIAPFSFFNVVTSYPPTIMVSIGTRADGSQKDTLRNLQSTKKCSISIAEIEHITPMHQSSTDLPPSQSETQTYEIPTTTILEEYPPIPADIKAAMFGEYLQKIYITGSNTIPVLISISHIYIDDSIITDIEKIKIKLDAIARMGGAYKELGEDIDIK